MKTFCVRICLSALTAMSLLNVASELQAAGPAATQQAVVQVQSALTESSVGWHRWGYRRGFGIGFRLGYGYGGYGYGYPSYGYAGYGYARPVIYSYPAYSYVRYRAPRYYSGYTYVSPYQTACCGYSYPVNQPVTYSVSSYSYPAQPAVYSSAVYSTPTYSVPTYSTPSCSTCNSSTYGYQTPSYTPDYSTPSVISPASTVYPTSGSTPAAPAPYPAPPVEYSPQPAVRRQPVASSVIRTAYSEYQTPAAFVAPSVSVGNSLNSASLTQGAAHAVFAPSIYQYQRSKASPTTQLVTQNSVW